MTQVLVLTDDEESADVSPEEQEGAQTRSLIDFICFYIFWSFLVFNNLDRITCS